MTRPVAFVLASVYLAGLVCGQERSNVPLFFPGEQKTFHSKRGGQRGYGHQGITKGDKYWFLFGTDKICRYETTDFMADQATLKVKNEIYFPEQAREIMRQRTVEGLTEREWEAYRKRHKHGDDQIRALINEFHGFRDSYDDMNFTPPYLSTIKARTFVVHGDRDKFFPVSIPVEMYQSIPNSYLWIVPNGGHVPIYGENEETFTKKAMEFLKGGWEAKNEPR